MRCRQLKDNPEITRLLRENWRVYYRLKQELKGDAGVLTKIPAPNAISKKKRTRRLWSRNELTMLFYSLRRHGLSVKAIVNALNA